MNINIFYITVLYRQKICYITKSPENISILGASLFKEGGFLLSRIALQYHRRKWA